MRQPACGVLVVGVRDPEEHAQARADLPHDVAVDEHARLAHALDDRFHLGGFESLERPAVLLALRAEDGRHLVMAHRLFGPSLLFEATA